MWSWIARRELPGRGKQRRVIFVPAGRDYAQGVRVAAIENGVVHMRKVTIARDFGTQVEVSDGLKDGDQVILNPSVNLAEGSKVQAQPEQTASSSN